MAVDPFHARETLTMNPFSCLAECARLGGVTLALLGTPIPIWASEDGQELVVVGSKAELQELTGAKV